LLAVPSARPFPVAEFFAGIGLVRQALEEVGFRVVWANDIDASKQALYEANFGGDDFVLEDIRQVRGEDVPRVSLATASFPCTDLSLAGNRAGLAGESSSMFWELARILTEISRPLRPPVLLLENVPSFASSNGGSDLATVIRELTKLGYSCGMFILDARHFVPQSRPRLFVVGTMKGGLEAWTASASPPWIARFSTLHPDLEVAALALPVPTGPSQSLRTAVELIPSSDERWWDQSRVERFVESLSPLQSDRLKQLRAGASLQWTTAYRRTRNGRPVWEMRSDQIAGCLRTVRGGSSKQALVEAGSGELRIRWLTPREYASLQGAPDFVLDGVRESQALFGFGDAVCVPVVAWIAKHLLLPLVSSTPEAPSPLRGLIAVVS